MFPIRILATAAVALAGGASASAQECDTPGGCGHSPLFGTGALFAPNKHHGRMPDANHPLCATKTYPISDWHYIRKYCGPTLNPGTCYGYYPTKWRKWEDICPQANPGFPGDAMPVLSGGPNYVIPNELLPTPTPLPAPMPKTDPLPKPTPVPKVDPVPKLDSESSIPMTIPAPLPPMPMASISATRPATPTVEPGIRPLRTLPNVVVPPVR